jgi:hypothetical protein
VRLSGCGSHGWGLLEAGISDAVFEYLLKPTSYIRAEEFNSINVMQFLH